MAPGATEPCADGDGETARHDAAAAEALADALAHDAFYEYVAGCVAPEQRRAALVAYMAAALAEGRASGGAVGGVGNVTTEAVGAAIWSLPAPRADAAASAAAARRAAMHDALGAAGLARWDAVVGSMEAEATRAPALAGALYLSILGVAPASQRGGVARRLLAPALRAADSASAACWLETFGEETLPFYARFGFRVEAGPIEERNTGARYWILLRPPGAPRVRHGSDSATEIVQ